jgi:hypothetical protein
LDFSSRGRYCLKQSTAQSPLSAAP